MKHLAYSGVRFTFDGVAIAFPHLRLHEELGRGAHGIVVRAIDQKLQRPVAFKVWDVRLTRSEFDRAMEETRKLAQFTGLLFVVVYGYGLTDGVPHAQLDPKQANGDA